MNIDEKIKNLKDITEKIEDENISLDESLKLFNDGVELVKDCYKSLNEAKGKVTILKKEVEELKEVQFE